jgi:hypothetical protein
MVTRGSLPRALAAWTLSFLVIGLLSGCGPYLAALTAPPPLQTATLDDVAQTIELSAGVALAFSCESWAAMPCQNAKARTDDAAVAQIYQAHLNHLSRDWGAGPGQRGPRIETGFVIAGLKPGKTTLRLSSDDGELAFAVEVVK